jgi:ABC-type uncharacterized transport system YnjBCD ATPase subunit
MYSLNVMDLNVWYGPQQALKNVSVQFPARRISAIIGPSGCGKSTLLKSLNRLLDLNESVRVDGRVLLDGEDIYAPGVDVTEVRTRIGLLAQKPFPLPMSIFDNVAYGLRLRGQGKREIAETVEIQLQAVGLWDEVKDRLKAPAHGVVGRAAAAALPGAHAGRPAGDPALRRVHGLARPDLGARHRGTAAQSAQPLHRRHGHARHRAGAAARRLCALYVAGRTGRTGAGRRILCRARGGADPGVSGAADWVRSVMPCRHHKRRTLNAPATDQEPASIL